MATSWKKAGVMAVFVAVLLAGCERNNNREVADMRSGREDSARQGGVVEGDQRMDDAAILAKLKVSDSLEVASAQYAMTKASDPTVKSYLQTLVRDHSKSAKDVKDLARRLRLTSATPPEDAVKEGHDMISQMRSWAKGKEFDVKFVEHAMDDHQRDIDQLRNMLDQAQNDALRQLISKTLPVLQSHLDKAKALNDRLATAR